MRVKKINIIGVMVLFLTISLGAVENRDALFQESVKMKEQVVSSIGRRGNQSGVSTTRVCIKIVTEKRRRGVQNKEMLCYGNSDNKTFSRRRG
jgi:hypothetical protein